MADIFREVDEDLRRERAQDVWRRYGAYILAIALVIVLATAGFVGWREWRQATLRTEGADLLAILDNAERGGSREAITALERFAEKADDGYALIARLNEAGLRAEQGDTEGASALYESVAENSDNPANYRNLAIVLLALNTVDSADPGTLIAKLEPVTGTDDPLRYSALEMTALLENKRGAGARALEIFKELAEAPGAPTSLRDRATEMLRILGGSDAESKGAS